MITFKEYKDNIRKEFEKQNIGLSVDAPIMSICLQVHYNELKDLHDRMDKIKEELDD